MASCMSLTARFKEPRNDPLVFIDAGVSGQNKSGSSSVGRASAFQAECREFEPRLPLHKSESRTVSLVKD